MKMSTNNDSLMQFTTDELLKYSRQLTLKNVGVNGQKKLKASSVLCIGAGGIGSPVSLYLCAAGIGHIGLVDPDTVSKTIYTDKFFFQKKILAN